MTAPSRIGRLIFRPKVEWDQIASEQTSVRALVLGYVLPLALLAPIATVIGMKTFDRNWDPVHGYLVPPERILATGATTYVAIVGSILLLAAIFALIAPMFGARRDFHATLKVAAYGSVPVLLAGATLLLPVMALVGLVGLCHSLFLFSLGAQRVLNVPAGNSAEYVGISMVLLGLASILAGAAASALGVI
jgi:hypothetical protein